MSEESFKTRVLNNPKARKKIREALSVEDDVTFEFEGEEYSAKEISVLRPNMTNNNNELETCGDIRRHISSVLSEEFGYTDRTDALEPAGLNKYTNQTKIEDTRGAIAYNMFANNKRNDEGLPSLFIRYFDSERKYNWHIIIYPEHENYSGAADTIGKAIREAQKRGKSEVQQKIKEWKKCGEVLDTLGNNNKETS